MRKFTNFCRRCLLKDGNTEKAKDIYLLTMRRGPRGIEVELSCRRCSWRWATTSINPDFPGYAEALAALDAPQQALAVIEPEAGPLSFIDDLGDVQGIFQAIERLTSRQRAALLLALSASVAGELASNGRYS